MGITPMSNPPTKETGRKRKTGTGHFLSNGEVSVELEAAWYRGWICENVYGLSWGGGIDRYPYVNLVVLDHEPDLAERRKIKAQFAKCESPDGAPVLDYPDLEAIAREKRRKKIGLRVVGK